MCLAVFYKTYLGSTAVHNVIRCVIDLTLHLNSLLLLVADSDVEDSKVAASQIQSNEVSLFCGDRETLGRREV